jgi:ribosomal subunit interface protein
MKIHLAANGLELNGELDKYAHKKLTRLNRKVPRRLRTEAGCEVTLAQATRRGVRSCTCEIVLSLGEDVLTAKECTQHLHTALDVAAANIEQQLKSYAHRRTRLLSAFRHPV